MKNKLIFNSDLHFEHKLWRRELLFWKDEIKSFKNRLKEFTQRWTDKEMLAQLEHFQNQFMLQEDVLNKYQNHINVHETVIANSSKKGKDILDITLVKKHEDFRNKMEVQRKIYGDLKNDFFKFLAKYL